MAFEIRGRPRRLVPVAALVALGSATACGLALGLDGSSNLSFTEAGASAEAASAGPEAGARRDDASVADATVLDSEGVTDASDAPFTADTAEASPPDAPSPDSGAGAPGAQADGGRSDAAASDASSPKRDATTADAAQDGGDTDSADAGALTLLNFARWSSNPRIAQVVASGDLILAPIVYTGSSPLVVPANVMGFTLVTLSVACTSSSVKVALYYGYVETASSGAELALTASSGTASALLLEYSAATVASAMGACAMGTVSGIDQVIPGPTVSRGTAVFLAFGVFGAAGWTGDSGTYMAAPAVWNGLPESIGASAEWVYQAEPGGFTPKWTVTVSSATYSDATYLLSF